uniref:Uncharacterized protein n=1 Tax=Ditylenchus dipsaci TaxID=166011 RepID=A0A915CP73_9BILA
MVPVFASSSRSHFAGEDVSPAGLLVRTSSAWEALQTCYSDDEEESSNSAIEVVLAPASPSAAMMDASPLVLSQPRWKKQNLQSSINICGILNTEALHHHQEAQDKASKFIQHYNKELKNLATLGNEFCDAIFIHADHITVNELNEQLFERFKGKKVTEKDFGYIRRSAEKLFDELETVLNMKESFIHVIPIQDHDKEELEENVEQANWGLTALQNLMDDMDKLKPSHHTHHTKHNLQLEQEITKFIQDMKDQAHLDQQYARVFLIRYDRFQVWSQMMSLYKELIDLFPGKNVSEKDFDLYEKLQKSF